MLSIKHALPIVVQVAFGYAAYALSTWIKEIALFCVSLFGIYTYTITGDKESMVPILTHLKQKCAFTSFRSVNGKLHCCGYFIGPYVIGFIELKKFSDVQDVVHAMCTKQQYDSYFTIQDDASLHRVAQQCNEICNSDTSVELYNKHGSTKRLCSSQKLCSTNGSNAKLRKNTPCSIKVYFRRGSYACFYYRGIVHDVSDLFPLVHQTPIVESIVHLYKVQKRATIFLYGTSGTGKSTVGFLVAKQLQGVFCHSFCPTDPGNTIESVVQDIREYEECDTPIIVVLEEVDTILQRVHASSVILNAKVPTCVKDKTSWNNFLDDLTLTKGIVLIMTSNKTKQEIDMLDPTYLRIGRIDKFFCIKQ